MLFRCLAAVDSDDEPKIRLVEFPPNIYAVRTRE